MAELKQIDMQFTMLIFGVPLMVVMSVL